MIVLNSLFPVFILVLAGIGLKRWELTHDDFLKTSDRLIYFIFFPTMLYWKIGSTSTDVLLGKNTLLSVLCSLALIYLISCLCIKWFRITDFMAGSFSQGCYRFNTYIGMAIVLNAVGEEGAGSFGVLVGAVIPIINVLAVSTLIWFSGKTYTVRQRARICGRALISNPLIIACIAGMIHARLFNGFPVFLDNTFRLSSSVTLPLALFSIGGGLTFDKLKGHFRISLLASILKLVIFPLIGFGCLHLFHVTGTSFKVAMIFFALPTSTAIYVLSSQLSSDTDLASAEIVLSTILSFFPLSVVLCI